MTEEAPARQEGEGRPATDEERRKEFLRRVREVVGEVALLMAEGGFHRYRHIQDLGATVYPAAALRQCKFMRTGQGVTVGYVSWALVSDEVLERMRKGAYRLRMEDWQGGENAVVVDVAGPMAAQTLVQALKRETFPDRPLLAPVPGDGEGTRLDEVLLEDDQQTQEKERS